MSDLNNDDGAAPATNDTNEDGAAPATNATNDTNGDDAAPAINDDDNELNVKHLVISAGGPAGGILFGALGYLHREKKWNINKIKTIYSCSVGSVLAILVSLKYDWDTLDDFMMKRPWSKIYSQSSSSSSSSSSSGASTSASTAAGAAAAAAAAAGVASASTSSGITPGSSGYTSNDTVESVSSSIRNVTTKASSYVYDMKYKFDTFMKIQSNKGMYGMKEFTESFRPAFEGKDYPTNMTMLEFYNATGIEHHFMVTELNKFVTIDLSYKTHPNLPVIEACYMSCTYPIIFEPIIRNGCAYVDGALINDYPLNECIRDQKCELKEILGFKIIWECKPTNISEKTSFIQFMTVFVNQIRTNLFENRKTTPIPNEVICMSKEQTMYDWKNIINDENYRRELLARGIMYAKMFLSYRNNYKA